MDPASVVTKLGRVCGHGFNSRKYGRGIRQPEHTRLQPALDGRKTPDSYAQQFAELWKGESDPDAPRKQSVYKLTDMLFKRAPIYTQNLPLSFIGRPILF